MRKSNKKPCIIISMICLTLSALMTLQAAQGAAGNEVVVYPVSKAAALSEIYRIEVNDIEIPVEHVMGFHVAHFSFSGRADISVAARDVIFKYTISPVSYRILSQPDGKRLLFSLHQPRKLVLYINDYKRLFIWADPLEKDPPRPGDEGVVNIMNFGVDPEGRHLATNRIQKAIEQVPENGVLYFPPGTYHSGMISLKSNMTLYLAAGALIQGSPLRDHYPTYEEMIESDTVYQPGKHLLTGHYFSNSQMILINGVENVKIGGRGTFDGNGYLIRAQGRAAYMLKIRNSRNILVEGVVLRNSAAWNTHILHSDNVVIRGTKLIQDFRVINTDGYNPDSSRGLLIEDNFAACNDDTVAIKSTNNSGLLRSVEDIIVRGNVFISQASALKVGTESKADHMRDITFIDNDVVECDRGMSLYCRDGATYSNIRYINNRFERLHIDDHRCLIHFYIEHRGGKGRIRDILIKDCIALVHWPVASRLEGLDSEHVISNVRIENLVVAGRPILKAEDLPLEMNDYVNKVEFSGP